MKSRFPTLTPTPARRASQRGMSLILVLLFLVILTLAGVAASTMSLSSERMARNSRDENIALQAAEAALRDARNDISIKRQLTGLTGATASCDAADYKAYCLPATTGKQVWEAYIDDSAHSAELGEFTGLTTAEKMPTVASSRSNGVSKQPRYVIEPIPDLVGNDLTKPPKYVYRITAVGYGANPSTRVLVQEVVRF